MSKEEFRIKSIHCLQSEMAYLCSTGNHVLYVIGVTGAIHVGIMPILGLIFYM